MTPAPADRRDALLVLARGGSARMGRPKGACVAADDPRPLLVRVLDLYEGRGWPATVVTSYAVEGVYRAIAGSTTAAWLVGDGAGGTARSVLRGVRAAFDSATHLWLHPVDLPRVAATTVGTLLEASCTAPGAVVVPMRRDEPGHPVVLPVRPGGAAWPEDHPGAMRDLLATGPWRALEVRVDDDGIVDDLDRPEDLD